MKRQQNPGSSMCLLFTVEQRCRVECRWTRGQGFWYGAASKRQVSLITIRVVFRLLKYYKIKIQQIFSAQCVNIFPQTKSTAWPGFDTFLQVWGVGIRNTAMSCQQCTFAQNFIHSWLSPLPKVTLVGGTLFPCSVTSSSRLGSIWATILNKLRSFVSTLTPEN